ncbi:hypothetical protein EXIGLDRAFT_153705 [Exidia glandulosa HHB12029]|uniref:F-box domain-containing protein n=1 Tax=Exidia glandulosa HHB12029 TaxID=1314781 RepID=A0A165QGT5_EXIGL|nr:hypothetical protein EXIGLDRAFT_153705 [Exidia glandulosa HHB12029]
MWDRLPIELVRAILLAAARAAVHGRRRWATQLALVSRDVYKLVHPVLYYTMVVTKENGASIRYLLDDESCAHMFAAVRHLVYPLDVTDGPRNDFGRPFTGLVFVDAPMYILFYLARRPDYAPRRLTVLSVDLDRVRRLPPISLANVTHIRGSVTRLLLDLDGKSPQDWADELFGHLPALTCLALDNLDTVLSTPLMNGLNHSDRLKPLIEAILRHSRLQRLTICINPLHRGTVLGVLSLVPDERVYVSSTQSHSLYERLIAEATADKTVWEEGDPVWTSKSPMA